MRRKLGAKAFDGQVEYRVIETYDKDTGVLRMRQVANANGHLHSPNNDTPGHEAYDEEGRPLSLAWYDNGISHRDNDIDRTSLPSTISYMYHRGLYSESFRKDGVYRSSNEGPAVIFRSLATDEIQEVRTAEDMSINYSKGVDPTPGP